MRFVLISLLVGCSTRVDLGGTGSTTLDSGVQQCGDLVAPQVDASCKACSAPVDPDCQSNGCYGGYWCDTAQSDCKSPPKSCP